MSGYCVSFNNTVGVGVPGSQVPETFARLDTWMDIDSNIRTKKDSNSFPVSNVGYRVTQGSTDANNYYVNQTNRGDIHPQNIEQLNLRGEDIWENLSYQDGPRTTIKETTEYSYSGNAHAHDKGTKFWTYTDAPQTTTKETTEYSYSGNAHVQDKGVKFWTYSDSPQTTIKETTEYSYTGNVGRGDIGITSRNQYIDGARKDSVRGSALVRDWVAPAGRQNILGSAEERMGKIDFGTFGDDNTVQGPGTLYRALPDASRFQSEFILGKQKIQPNKIQTVDDRQIASYLVEQLQKNSLSIYTNNPEGKVPEFGRSSFTPEVVVKDIGDVCYKGIEDTVSMYGSN